MPPPSADTPAPTPENFSLYGVVTQNFKSSKTRVLRLVADLVEGTTIAYFVDKKNKFTHIRIGTAVKFKLHPKNSSPENFGVRGRMVEGVISLDSPEAASQRPPFTALRGEYVQIVVAG